MKKNEIRDNIMAKMNEINFVKFNKEIEEKFKELIPCVEKMVNLKKFYEKSPSISNGSRKQEAEYEAVCKLKEICFEIIDRYGKLIDRKYITDKIVNQIQDASKEIGLCWLDADGKTIQ